MNSTKFDVTGMSCAACSARVEKAVKNVDGVTSCAVNLLTNSMTVDGSADTAEIIRAVENAGYGASVSAGIKKSTDDTPATKEIRRLKHRLISSAIILAALMYVSMGHMMWDWPLPFFLKDGKSINHVAVGVYELVLCVAVMIINRRFFISGFKGVLHGAPNMDTLVAMGSGVSFLYSLYALFNTFAAYRADDIDRQMKLMDEFYFESAAMILTLITIGKFLEAKAKGRTTNALKGLMDLSPKTAILIKDGSEITVAAETLKPGDIFLVKPGAAIPVDGIVLSGQSAVNEASLTGESIPAEKSEGSEVFTATINQSGVLRCLATKVGEDTSLAKIIKMVSDASSSKAPIAKTADKVSGIFVPAVIIIALITGCIWLFAGKSAGFAMARAVSVLVVSCPCALGLATPVAIMVGSGVGAGNGILFKNAAALEACGRTRIVALDKTGTITGGEPEVTDIFAAGKTPEETLLKLSCLLERNSEHPLSKAIVGYCDDRFSDASPSGPEITGFEVLPGHGLRAVCDGKSLCGGNAEYIKQCLSDEGGKDSLAVFIEMLETAGKLAEEGKTPLFFSHGSKFLGIIAVADTIKPDSAAAVASLKELGLKVVMITGDNEKTAMSIGRSAGVDKVYAGVLPDGKESIIRGLKKEGATAMVGDGINDAPALTSADIGIAIGAGTDIARDAADIVLMKSSLADAETAISLSRATLRNIHENLFWAFFYNIILIPIAAGAWIPVTGLTMNPMLGAAAMSLSSFCVCMNALRLNFFKAKKYTKENAPEPANNKILINNGGNTMEKTLKINGMMCGHCEARVKKTLEKFPEIAEATPDHTKNSVIVRLNSEPDWEAVKAAIAEQDYEFVGVE